MGHFLGVKDALPCVLVSLRRSATSSAVLFSVCPLSSLPMSFIVWKCSFLFSKALLIVGLRPFGSA